MILSVVDDQDLANRIRELIAGEPDVSDRNMFGRLVFLVGGHMSVAAGTAGSLVVRVDPADADEFLARPHVQPFVMAGRPIDGRVRVDAEVVRPKRQLKRWVSVGVDHEILVSSFHGLSLLHISDAVKLNECDRHFNRPGTNDKPLRNISCKLLKGPKASRAVFVARVRCSSSLTRARDEHEEAGSCLEVHPSILACARAGRQPGEQCFQPPVRKGSKNKDEQEQRIHFGNAKLSVVLDDHKT